MAFDKFGNAYIEGIAHMTAPDGRAVQVLVFQDDGDSRIAVDWDESATSAAYVAYIDSLQRPAE